MEKLRDLINSMPTREQILFAWNCGTTIGYIRKRISLGRPFSPQLARKIADNSKGKLTYRDLRPDDRAPPARRRSNAA